MEIARLVYLATHYKVQVPRKFWPYVGEWTGKLYLGLSAALPDLGAPLEHLQMLYEQGEQMGPGTEEECRLLIADMIHREVSERELSLHDTLVIYNEVEGFVRRGDLLEESEVDLSTVQETDLVDIPKWDSGFTPLDMALGGMYQGLLMIMARPGVGKTSMTLSIAEGLVTQGIPIVYIENEIPESLMLPRMKPIFQRTKFKKNDRLICASWSSKEVLEFVRDNPDPERVVIYDSPDVMTGGDDKRLQLEKAYQDMVKVKMLSKAVIVTSQPRRRDDELRITSAAESWAKAWYADAMVGLQSAPQSRLRIRVLKNRFGPNSNEVLFGYDYETLEAKDSAYDESDW